MRQHDFFKLMGAVKESLARDYERIRSRSRDDPGTAGDQAEEDWAEILRNWLPATYPVITKGRILFPDGSSSPQVDLLVLKASYPRGLRNEKYIFAGGVIAAFECKLTLRNEDVGRAFEVASKIKQKAPTRVGTPYDELNSAPIFGLLAHSRSFRGIRASWKLHEVVEKYQTKHVRHPRELLDIICVADTATLPMSKHIVMGHDLNTKELEELKEMEASALISTMYVIHDEDREASDVDHTGAILAGLIHELTFRMAFEDPSVRDWADHLSNLGFYGGIGRPVYWTEEELSTDVRDTLNKVGRQGDHWSRWCKYLP
jgi:uncharacterized protein DUF6602